MYLITVDTDLCDGCRSCADACPAQYLVIMDGKAEVGDGECMGCESCIEICPNKAISIQEL